MKNMKTIVTTAVIVALVAVLFFVVWSNRKTYALKSRIAQYELVKQEQALVLDILKIRYDTAVIQKRFAPAQQPVQQNQPIVKPPETKE